jgi:hypothetical protein
VKILKNGGKNMEIIIGIRKEDLLKLLNAALEKVQIRKMLNEECHFDLVLHPASSNNEVKDFFIDHFLYYAHIEYFTSSSSDSSDYISETCKIELEAPVVILHRENLKRLPILLGLWLHIEKAIDMIKEIDNETLELKISPIEIEDMYSCSITSIEECLTSDIIKIF